MTPSRLSSILLALGIAAWGHSAAAAAPPDATTTGLRYSAPASCPKERDVQSRVHLAGDAPAGSRAELVIRRKGKRYTARLTTEILGTTAQSEVMTETCAAAVTWGIFAWNALFPVLAPHPAEPESVAAQPAPEPLRQPIRPQRTERAGYSDDGSWRLPETHLQAELTGLTNLLDAMRLGAELTVAGEIAFIRVGARGTFWQPTHTQNAFESPVAFHQQALGVSLCGLSNTLFAQVRAGLCALVDGNWLQIEAENTPSNATLSGRWLSVGLGAVATVRLAEHFSGEFNVRGGFSPWPIQHRDPVGGLGRWPNTDTYLQLAMGFALDAAIGAAPKSSQLGTGTRTPVKYW